MEVMEAIKKRRSVRRYAKRKVEEDKLLRILEAARLAPSARNIQNRLYIVVENITGDLVEACNSQGWISSSPVIIAGILDPTVNRWADTDMAIAFEHMVLEAVELGLGTCWVGAFDESKVKSLLGVPGNMKVYALLTLGYPEMIPSSMVGKKNLEEIWARERYSW
ncbi:MAG: nitroreductase family protein [Candidatus Methanofastidiosa archaeon]|nr:nitroreductase family protein [Candidatus Methanofastidiosa archaeon]